MTVKEFNLGWWVQIPKLEPLAVKVAFDCCKRATNYELGGAYIFCFAKLNQTRKS